MDVLRWSLALGLAILAPLGAGCGSTPEAPAILEDGKSLWRRVETEHFVVESNASSERKVLRIAGEFEVLWHAFASVPILGLRPPSEKPIVVVLRDTDEYRYVGPELTAGFFVQETALGPLIVLPPNRGAFEEVVIKHELAHFIGSESLDQAPKWMQEGLAQVMETASYDVQKGEILFGSHSSGRVQDASYPLPAERFTGPWPSEVSAVEAAAYYARSWLLCHYLIDNELQGFLDMLVRIRNGEPWQTAWAQEILVRPSEIDDALDRYHMRAKYGLWTVQAQLPDPSAFHFSDVSRAEALALRSVLYTCSSKAEAAEQDLGAARALDPGSERVRKVSESRATAQR